MNLEEQYRKEKEEADLLFEQQRQVNLTPVHIHKIPVFCSWRYYTLEHKFTEQHSYVVDVKNSRFCFQRECQNNSNNKQKTKKQMWLMLI